MSFSLSEPLIRNIQKLLPELLEKIPTHAVTAVPLEGHATSIVIASERPTAALFPVPLGQLNLTPELRERLGNRKVWVTIRAK